MSKPSILFMGTPEFARVSLEALWAEGYPLVGVVSQPDKPSGRGQKTTSPPTAAFAIEKKIPLFQPENLKSEGIQKTVEKMKLDFIIVAAYGHFLPRKIFEAPATAAINVHASLLPRYRGAAPISRAIMNGETQTGVTLMKIVPKMDAGPIYAQEKCPIKPSDNAETLGKTLSHLGARLLLENLPQIYEGKIRAIGQDEALASYAPLLKKEDGKIDWERSAEEIRNLIRGLIPWPGAHTIIDNKNLKIYDSAVASDPMRANAGTVYLISDRGIHVACGKGSLCLMEVQLEGRKRMSAAEFARGFRLKEGCKFK